MVASYRFSTILFLQKVSINNSHGHSHFGIGQLRTTPFCKGVRLEPNHSAPNASTSLILLMNTNPAPFKAPVIHYHLKWCRILSISYNYKISAFPKGFVIT